NWPFEIPPRSARASSSRTPHFAMMLKKALIAAGLRRSRSDFVERSTSGDGSYRVAGYRGARAMCYPPISEYISSDFGRAQVVSEAEEPWLKIVGSPQSVKKHVKNQCM